MAKARPEIGVFAGIFNRQGDLLVKRRPQWISSPGEWDLPGGAVESENNDKAQDERIIGEELAREVLEEVGVIIDLPFMPQMFPAVLAGGQDWAFIIPLPSWFWREEPQGEFKWVSPNELRELAEGPKDNRLVSGWGKRMCRLCLKALEVGSPNPGHQIQARSMLAKIQSEMQKR